MQGQPARGAGLPQDFRLGTAPGSGKSTVNSKVAICTSHHSIGYTYTYIRAVYNYKITDKYNAQKHCQYSFENIRKFLVTIFFLGGGAAPSLRMSWHKLS